MKSASRGAALAVPTVLAMTLGGLLLSAPAHAADAFAVTNPTNGSTGVAQTFPNVVPFAGTGLPVGDTASVTYLDASGTVRQATFGGSTNDGAGNWTGNENFAQLSVGQTHVVATVTAVDENLVADPSVPTTTTTFDLAVAPNPADPFTVTQPATNSTTPVESTTPTFAGTGTVGDSITITYGARAAKTGIAATTTVQADESWTTTTDFSQMEPGSTDGSAIVTETDPAGNPVPGAGAQRINFTFPTAPATAATPTLVLGTTKTSVLAASIDGIPLAATGFSPDEQVVVAVTDASGKAVVLGDTAQTFADDTDGSFTGTVLLPATATGGTYTVTITGVRSKTVVSASFYALGAPTLTNPTNGENLIGDTVTFAGTGTPGSDIGVVAVPTAEFKAALAKEQAAMKSSGSPKAASRLAVPKADATMPADPTDRIVVGADGRWKVTIAAKPGDYTAVAISALLNADGTPVTDAAGDPIVAGPSNPVEFTLAAAAIAPAADGTTALAYTGSNAAPIAITGGLVLMVGLGLLVVARRRRTALEG